MNKIKKSISLILVVSFLVFSFGCDWITLNKSNLTNDDNSPNSALSLQFGDSAIYPPTGIQVTLIEKLPSSYKVHLEWTGSEGAVQYKISRSLYKGHSYSAVGSSIDCAFVDTINNLNYSKVFYKVLAENKDGKESEQSAYKEVELVPTYTYNGEIPQGQRTQGNSRLLTIQWNPIASAQSYRIERIVTNQSFTDPNAVVLLEETYFPENPQVSLVEFKDTEAAPGFLYDYRVTPIDSRGVVSSNSLILSEAWITPAPYEPEASCGHAVRGNPGASNEYSIIELSWKAITILKDANGLRPDVSAEVTRWQVYCKYDPSQSAETLEYCSNELECTDEYLNVLNLPTLGDTWLNDEQGNYTHNSGANKAFDNGIELFYKTSATNSAVQEFKLRISVEDKNIVSDDNFNESWYQYYYFYVTGIRKPGGAYSFETAPTATVTGYAASPDVVDRFGNQCNLLGKTGSNRLNFRTELQADGIALRWRGDIINWIYAGTSPFEECAVYRLNDANNKYEIIDYVARDANEYIDNSVTNGKTYRYRIAFRATGAGAPSNHPCEATSFREVYYE